MKLKLLNKQKEQKKENKEVHFLLNISQGAEERKPRSSFPTKYFKIMEIHNTIKFIFLIEDRR